MAGTWLKGAGWTAAAIAYLFYGGWLRLQYPDRERFPVRGLDVSRHQGEIDWAAVQRQGFAFVYIKASEGGDGRDTAFERNWRGAQEAGLAPGAYHFFTFCKSGAEQARNFLEAIAPVRGPMLPPAVDVERRGNCAARPAPAELRRELDAFALRVRRELGVAPVLYVTADVWRDYRAALAADAELWVRSVVFSPRRAFGDRWRLWQFAGRARVAGVGRPVDLDAFNGSHADWRRYLRERLKLKPDSNPDV